jgi:alpha-glucosidase
MSPTTPWWRSAVIYQVYIRSFADGDGDGVGDIAGLRSRLPYLKSLGVDALWINPWYKSPMADGGYDVADFRAIDPLFGTIADAEQLIAEAHEHGIRIIPDIVPNHTSDEHIWFQAALDAGPGSPERDRYIFRPGRGPDGTEPPNNWVSEFGGPAWTRIPDGDWYLHLYAPEQPDLNWQHPDVHAEFESILRFWFDRGVDGFRIDVAHGLAKDADLPDLAPDQVKHPHWDRDEVHDIYRTWRTVADEFPGDRAFVAEAWADTPERLAAYVRPGGLHTAFNFDFLMASWDAKDLRTVIDDSLAMLSGVGAPATWVLSNHDVVRHASRLVLPPGTDENAWLLSGGHAPAVDAHQGLRRARAATLLMLALPGSSYVYQGEELGLPEVADLPFEVLQDPIWEQTGRVRKGRDGCRVPLPWTTSGPSYGFGAGGAWLPQPEAFAGYAVEAQDGVEGSTLELYRTALRLRRKLLQGEDLTWADASPAGVLDFVRHEGWRCVTNLSDRAVPLPAGEVLLTSGPLEDGLLGPDTTAWLG